MLIEYKQMAVNELKSWDKNPRFIVDCDYQRLLQLIEKYPILKPLKIDGRDGVTVLGGNMRLTALKELNVENVLVAVLNIKTDEEAIEIAIRDNTEFGEYIMDKYNSLIDTFKFQFRKIEVTSGKINLDLFKKINISKFNSKSVSEIEKGIISVIKFENDEIRKRFINFVEFVNSSYKDELLSERILHYLRDQHYYE